MALFLLAFCTPLWAKVTATLERSQISEGETVQLILQRDSRGDGEADLAPLQADFDVLGSSQSSSVRIVNGSIATERALQITLAPRRTGTLTIPPLSWAGEQSQALTLHVAAAGERASGTQAPQVFLTAELDTASPYVLSGVLLKVKIHTGEPLYRAGLEFDGSADVLVQPIGEDTRERQTRDGREYTVITRTYLLTPQRSGTLSLEGPVLDAEIADPRRRDRFGDGGRFESLLRDSPLGSMVRPTRPLRLRGKALNLDVRPRPPGVGALWLPARDVALRGEWDGNEVRTGEPVTLQLRIEATGLGAEQLPDPAALLQLPDGLKAYPDQASLTTAFVDGQIVGTREQSVAIIPARPGEFDIAAPSLSWWNTATDRAESVRLPAHRLRALPAPGHSTAAGAPTMAPALPPQAAHPSPASETASASATGQPPQGESARWRWTSAGLAALWLATLAAWAWSLRRSRTPSAPLGDPRASQAGTHAPVARRAFEHACRTNDAQGARRALLAWVHAIEPDTPVKGLHGLASRIGNDAAELLRQLDRCCFTSAPWEGRALAEALRQCPLAAKADTDTRASPLRPLYS